MVNIIKTTSTESQIITAWILLGISISLTFVIGLWLVKGPDVFIQKTLGINETAIHIPWAWLLMIVIALGYSVYTVRSVAFVNQHKFDFTWLKLIGIWAAIVTGIVEEVAFRQKLMDWVMANGVDAPLQIAISALVFGAAHSLWVCLKGEFKIVLPVVISTTVLGGLLAALYIVADRNVLPCIIAHTAINLVIEPWLILAAVSGRFQSSARK